MGSERRNEYRVVGVNGLVITCGGQAEALALAKGNPGTRVERREVATEYGEWEEVSTT